MNTFTWFRCSNCERATTTGLCGCERAAPLAIGWGRMVTPPPFCRFPLAACVHPDCNCDPEGRVHGAEKVTPRPDPKHSLWRRDPATQCPSCDGIRWENVGVAFLNNWECLDCGWRTGSTGEGPPGRVHGGER